MNKYNEKLCAMNCHYRFYELEDFFSRCKENGYRYVELWTGPQHFFMDHNGYESIEKLLDLEKRYDIKIIGICPEQTNPKPNNMAAKDKQMQKRVLQYFKNAIDVASEIKANQVVITSGWAFYSEDVEDAYQRSIKMLKRICEYAESKNMNLAIEALQKEESLLANSLVQLKKLIDDVGHKRLKVCLDIGAMSAANDTITDYFNVFHEDIIHTHFVDVDQITHLSWGDGKRDMKKDLSVFLDNHYQGLYSVECVNARYFKKPWIADEQSMAKYRQTLKEMKECDNIY